MIDFYTRLTFETSKLITRRYSTSFSIAVSLLEPRKQLAISSIYGFVRLADEIVDTFHPYNQALLLDNFERDYAEACRLGLSTNLAIHAFVKTVQTYHIDQALVDAFLKSMRADLTKTVYQNQDELNEYIFGSADVVGLMCLQVFTDGDITKYEKLKYPAMKLGSAFQKVNFLRDLRNDYTELNRTYFPDFEVSHFDEKMKEEIIQNINEDFEQALPGIQQLQGRSQLAVYVAYNYYHHLLKKLTKARASEILGKRFSVPTAMKLLLLFKSIARYYLKTI